MDFSLLIECDPGSVIQGGRVRVILTPVGPDQSVCGRPVVLEVIRPADGSVVFRQEASLPKTNEPHEVVWDTDPQLPSGLYQVGACFSDEGLYTLTLVVVKSAIAQAETENIRQALKHLRMSKHWQNKDPMAAAAALTAAAASFSKGQAHESALNCWRNAMSTQVKMGLYAEARESLRNALSDLFEILHMRVKNPSSHEQQEIPLPERLPLRYSDVDGLRELAPAIRSGSQFDSEVQQRIQEHVDAVRPSENLYGLLLLCEEFSVRGEYYERLLHRYYELPAFKDISWASLERCDREFADEALRDATELAFRNREGGAYREFLSGSYAIIGHVQPFLRNAMRSPVNIGSHIMLELSQAARLQFGGKDDNFKISDENNKTLAEIPINDQTQRVLLPMLKKQFKETKSRLGQLLAPR